MSYIINKIVFHVYCTIVPTSVRPLSHTIKVLVKSYCFGWVRFNTSKWISSQRRRTSKLAAPSLSFSQSVMVNKRIVFNPGKEGPRYECVDDEGTGELTSHQVCVQVSTCVLRTPNNKITKLLQDAKKDADKVRLLIKYHIIAPLPSPQISDNIPYTPSPTLGKRTI